MCSELSRTHTDNQCINTDVSDPIRQLHGPSRVLPSFRNFMDRPGSFELHKTAVLAFQSSNGIPGHNRTNMKCHGATWWLYGSEQNRIIHFLIKHVKLIVVNIHILLHHALKYTQNTHHFKEQLI